MIMKNIGRLFFGGAAGLLILTAVLPAPARPPKSEDELLTTLSSPKDKEVYNALQDLEKQYPADEKILPPIKNLLADPRPTVRRKAARVLGAIHADVSNADIKNICGLLTAADKHEVIDGLIALRGLKAPSAIPQILPLLDNPDLNIKRDSCRTLAVLGDKSLIPKIKPLLDYPDVAVQKDAADAIDILKEK
jgi:HEAT repeat protein